MIATSLPLYNKNAAVRSAFNEYFARNWLPIPAFVGSKRPSVASWQEINSGTLEQFWQSAPHNSDALALLCGARTNLLVIDFDETDFRNLFDAEMPNLTDTMQVQTQSNNAHYYYHVTGAAAQLLTDATGRSLPGIIEARWNGQIVIAPPSAGYMVIRNTDPQHLTLEAVADILLFIQRIREALQDKNDTQQTSQSDKTTMRDRLKQAKKRQIDEFFTRKDTPDKTKENLVEWVETILGRGANKAINTPSTGTQDDTSFFAGLSDDDKLNYLIDAWNRERKKRVGRNETLFYTACQARDRGAYISDIWSLESIFVNARSSRHHRSESDSSRRREFHATLQSVYSRPPRSTDTWHRPAGLDDGTRERLLQDKETLYGVQQGPALLKVWELLVCHHGWQAGQVITRKEAQDEIDCGRRSIFAALDLMDMIFEAKIESFPPHPPTSCATRCLPGHIHEQTMHVCRGEKCVKNTDERGRPARTYRIPSVEMIVDAYQTDADPDKTASKWTTPLSKETLTSSRQVKTRLHASFIQRNPGCWTYTFLKNRFGVSKWTIKNYERDIGICSEPNYDSEVVWWSNINSIPVTDDHRITGFNDQKRMGWFLTDNSGKKYPALKPIAIRLLKQKRFVTLYRQTPNMMYIGKRPDESVLDTMKRASIQRNLFDSHPKKVSQPPKQRKSLEQIVRETQTDQNHTDNWMKNLLPEISSSEPVSDSEIHTPENHASVDPNRYQPVPQHEKIRRQMENEGFPFDLEDRLLVIIGDKKLHRKQKRYRCKHLINCNFSDPFLRDVWLEWCKGKMSKRAQSIPLIIDETPRSEEDRQAEYIKEAINSMKPEAFHLHISFRTAKRLIDNYGYHTVNNAVNYMLRRNNIVNPAGFLVSYLRSNARIAALQKL